MKTILLAPALAAVALAIPATAIAQRAGAPTIVVVDRQRIFRECTACKAAQVQLQQQAATIERTVQALGTPLQTEANSLRTAAEAANKLTGAARTAAETPLRSRAQALEARQNGANQQIQVQEATFQRNRAFVAQQLTDRMDPIITQVMTARGAIVAVDKAATIANAAAIDVTADVLAQLNTQLPSVRTVAPAAPAPVPAARPQGR